MKYLFAILLLFSFSVFADDSSKPVDLNPSGHAQPKNASDALTAKIRADEAEFVQACQLGKKMFRIENGDEDSCTARGGQITSAKRSELSSARLKDQRMPRKNPMNWRSRHQDTNPATARPDNEDPD